MSSFNKAKTRRGKKFLENRAPKIIENDKMALIINGSKTTETIKTIFHELRALKKPFISQLNNKNQIYPFEDDTSLVKFSTKYDASLFIFGHNSKKHPNSLIFGRMFDHQLLDMVEFHVEKHIPSAQFGIAGIPLGIKPSIILQGSNFECDEVTKRIGNLLVDWFRGSECKSIRLNGMELVISLTSINSTKLHFRVYRSELLKESGSHTPRVKLVEIGPSVDFTIVRHKFSSDSLMKKALKRPRLSTQSTKKNISHNVFGTKLARIHTGRQQLDSIQTRKTKALKRIGKTKSIEK